MAQAIGKPVFKLNVYKSRDDMLADLALQSKLKSLDTAGASAPVLTPEQLGRHIGVVCDRSGMSPIVGPRYNVPGANYDLCEAEFNLLPEAERVLFVKIAQPGDAPLPCLPGAQAETAGSTSKLPHGHPMLRQGGGRPMMMMRRGGGSGRTCRRGGGGGLSSHGGRFHGGRKPAVYQRMLRCGVPLDAVFQKLAHDHGIDPSGGLAVYQQMLRCGVPLDAVFQKLAHDHGIDPSGGLGGEDQATLASLAASLNQMAGQGNQEGDGSNANADHHESPLGALLSSFMGPDGVAAAVAAASGVASAAAAAAQAASDSDDEACQSEGAETASGASHEGADAGGAAAEDDVDDDEALPPGVRVTLRNLQQRTDLNGSKGTILDSFQRQGRAMHTVELDFRGRGAGQPEVVNVPAVHVLALDNGGCEMAKRSAMQALKEAGKVAGKAAAAKAAAKAEAGAAKDQGNKNLGGAGGARGPAAAAAFAQLLEALAGNGNNQGSNGGKCGGRNNNNNKKNGGKKGTKPAVHYSVTCDRSGMSPIVGNRFSVLGANYDLCEAEFDLLPESERVLYVKITHPGAEPQPCLPKGEAAGLEQAEDQGGANTATAKQTAAASVPPFKKAMTSKAAKPTAEMTTKAAPETKPEDATGPTKPGAAAAVEPKVETTHAMESEPAPAAEKEEAAAATAATTEFATELAELRALGLVGSGPGGAEVALKLLRANLGRLDSVVNALLDGN